MLKCHEAMARGGALIVSSTNPNAIKFQEKCVSGGQPFLHGVGQSDQRIHAELLGAGVGREVK